MLPKPGEDPRSDTTAPVIAVSGVMRPVHTFAHTMLLVWLVVQLLS